MPLLSHEKLSLSRSLSLYIYICIYIVSIHWYILLTATGLTPGRGSTVHQYLLTSVRLPLNEYPWILVLGTLMKICWKSKNFRYNRTKIKGKITWTQVRFVCCWADVNLPQKQFLRNTEFLHIVDSDVRLKSSPRTHCCFSTATVVTWTHCSVTLHVTFLSRFITVWTEVILP